MTEGFLAARRTSPVTLGGVALAHAAVLTAVILAKGPEILRGPDVTVVRTIPDTPDPPPLPSPPQPRDNRSQSRLDTPPRTIPTEPAGDTVVIDLPRTPPLPPLPPGPSADPLPQPPAHTPVLTDPVALDRYAGAFQPLYPPALMRAEVEGRAVVRVLIGADGRVRAVEIVAADDPAFAEATKRQALRHWRFRPATRDGLPVEAWKTMTVRFKLEA